MEFELPNFEDDITVMADAAAIYREAFTAGITPDTQLTVSEWADEHRMLSAKSAAEAGRWRTSRTPYLREIMDCLSSTNPIQRVVFMAGAQVGKTETGNNWFGYVVHHSPAPMLMVQPSLDLAKRLSVQRIAPLIEETPVLRGRIADKRSRDSGNTQLVKEFQGGLVIIAGANSAKGLRSMPIRFLFLDEVDAYPLDVDGEGDPLKLAERRTTTFARRKIFICSTPTTKETSRIEREYLGSDQRRYFVPCPHCGEKQWLKWGGLDANYGLKWDEGDPSTAYYLCEVNGCIIEEHNKTEMLAAGEWRATAQSDGRTAGFHLSSLYSPLGWKHWHEIVREFLDAKNDATKLKEWVNTVLGETWEDEISARIGAESLIERCEEYRLTTVPTGGLVLTAGVDVQDNRLAVTVKAWGVDEESWLVNWMEIYGDPADLTSTGVWAQLDTVLQQEYTHENGAKLKIMATAVDTGGHFTHEAYMFCRNRKQRRVIAIKGSSIAGKSVIGKPSKQDVNYKGQVIKSGVELWAVGTDTAKSTIYGRLKRQDRAGAGVLHFPLGLPDEYFEQLTAEKQIPKYINGFQKRVWVKKDSTRNEALDCEVYAYAALQYFYTTTNRSLLWLRAAQLLDKLAGNGNEAEQAVVKASENLPKPKKPRFMPASRSGGFVKGWK